MIKLFFKWLANKIRGGYNFVICISEKNKSRIKRYDFADFSIGSYFVTTSITLSSR